MKLFFSVAFWACVGVVGTGCVSSAKPPSATNANAAPPHAPVIEVPTTVVSPYSDEELAREFEKARALLLADKPEEASPIFERLVRLAPTGRTAPPSLFNDAIAREALGDREGALQRLADLLARFPDHELAREALFRAMRLDAYVERWSDLRSRADAALALKGLTVMEAIEAEGSKALALVEEGDVEGASKALAPARDRIEADRLGEAGKPPLAIALVHFALGEIRRAQSEKITFDPMPQNFGDALEARCTGLLDAQNAYTDAMKSLDAHWSAMAGYRVGQLYQTLHRDVMRITPPVKATTLRQKQLFEGAMRLRYRVLLEKGLKMMEATVRLGDRTGEDSVWVHRAREAKKDLETSLADEKEALSKLPFTEAEIQAALDGLKAKGSAKTP